MKHKHFNRLLSMLLVVAKRSEKMWDLSIILRNL